MKLTLAVLSCAILGISLGVGPAAAETYYVDFDGGSDSNDGRSPEKALKRAPGDPLAAGNAKALALQPGDMVVFKGGVVYRGSIMVPAGGTEGKPVIFDGNTEGKFGQGRAIIDGSELLTGWKRCESAEECGGNPNWRNIHVAWLPGGVDPLGANLFEDDRMIWMAQEPNLKDPFYLDDLGTYRKVPAKQVTTSTLVDAANLTQTDAHYWDGAMLLLWGTPNLVYPRKITAFDPGEHKLTFEKVPGTYTDRDNLYAIANSIHVLDAPGESVITDETDAQGRRKLYLWPLGAGDVNEKKITYSVRRQGIDLAGKSHVTIQGFIIQKQGGPERVVALTNSGSQKVLGLVVRDNEIRWGRCRERTNAVSLPNLDGAVIDGNRVYENIRARGLAFNNGVNVVASNNVLRKNGGTGLVFFGCQRSKMVGNTVTDHTGVHANALTVYLGSSDVLLFGNKVFDSNIALTTQESKNITVAYNILTGREGYVVADWGKCENLKFYNNVIVSEKSDCALTVGLNTKGIVLRNNICSGHAAARTKLGPPEDSNNLYTALSFMQKGKPLEDGNLLVSELAKVFVDAASRDYRLAPDSPAIDAGVDVGLAEDMAGTKVPQGEAPDIGAYEFKP